MSDIKVFKNGVEVDNEGNGVGGTPEPEALDTHLNELSAINPHDAVLHIAGILAEQDRYEIVQFKRITYEARLVEGNLLKSLVIRVDYDGIMKNGEPKKEQVHLAYLDLDEDDQMMFETEGELKEYLDDISEEDNRINEDKVFKIGNLHYLYFTGKSNHPKYLEHIESFKARVEQMGKDAFIESLGDNFDSNGQYIDTREVEDEEVEDLLRQEIKPSSTVDIGDKNLILDDTPKREVPTDTPDEPVSEDTVDVPTEQTDREKLRERIKDNYFPLTASEVIEKVRKQEILMHACISYINGRRQELERIGVTDIYLKDIKIEYDWDDVKLREGEAEHIIHTSKYIRFKLALDIVANYGITADYHEVTWQLSKVKGVPKNSAGEDKIPYVTSPEFKDLVIGAEGLINGFKEGDYYQMNVKGITLYIGKEGEKRFENYVKDAGIKKSDEYQFILRGKRRNEFSVEGNIRQGMEDTREHKANGPEELAQLVARLYKRVMDSERVTNEHLIKLHRMLHLFFQDKTIEFTGKLRVQPTNQPNLQGVWLVRAEGGNFLKGMSNSNRVKKGGIDTDEYLILHPFFIIASNGTYSEVIYNRLNQTMTLSELETTLRYNGYDEINGITTFLTTRNYVRVMATHNAIVNPKTQRLTQAMMKQTGGLLSRGTKNTGRFIANSYREHKRHKRGNRGYGRSNSRQLNTRQPQTGSKSAWRNGGLW